MKLTYTVVFSTEVKPEYYTDEPFTVENIKRIEQAQLDDDPEYILVTLCETAYDQIDSVTLEVTE